MPAVKPNKSSNSTFVLNKFANLYFSATLLSLQKIPPTLVIDLASENYC